MAERQHRRQSAAGEFRRAGLAAFAHSIGDGMSRLDRIETVLNEAAPGNPRDTTTPVSMLHNLNRLVLESTLSESSRGHLAAWLVGNRTGDKRLRAVPSGWRIGDKTGSGENGTANDIAVVWPVNRAPVLVTAYFTGSGASAEERHADRGCRKDCHARSASLKGTVILGERSRFREGALVFHIVCHARGRQGRIEVMIPMRIDPKRNQPGNILWARG